MRRGLWLSCLLGTAPPYTLAAAAAAAATTNTTMGHYAVCMPRRNAHFVLASSQIQWRGPRVCARKSPPEPNHGTHTHTHIQKCSIAPGTARRPASVAKTFISVMCIEIELRAHDRRSAHTNGIRIYCVLVHHQQTHTHTRMCTPNTHPYICEVCNMRTVCSRSCERKARAEIRVRKLQLAD